MTHRQHINQRQRIFIDNFIKTGDKVQSYLLAYKDANYEYNEDSILAAAKRLLGKSAVKKEIAERNARLALDVNVTKEDMILELKEVLANSKNDRDKASILKTIDLMNKLLGFYESNINLKVTPTIKLNFGSDE